MNVQFDRAGMIIAGEGIGQFVKVVRGSDTDSSYLILKSEDISFKEGFDDWVEDMECLEAYFEESNWVVDWK